MTVSSEQSRVQYATDGVATSFPVPFRFLQNRDLLVTLIQDQDGTTHELVLDSDYTLSGANQAAGGTLTTTTTLASGQTLIVERVMSITQETAYQRNDPFPERAHEQALDRLTMIAQQFESWLGTLPGAFPRVLHFPIEFPRRQSVLPSAHTRARKALIFDALGNVTVGKDDYEDQAANAAQSAAEAAASAASTKDDREAVEKISNSFGDLDSARDEWEEAVQTSQEAAANAHSDARRAETAANTSLGASSAVPYRTLAELQASPTPTGRVWAAVTNDPDDSNNGFYIWTGSQWRRSDMQWVSWEEIEPVTGNAIGVDSFNDIDRPGFYRDQYDGSAEGTPFRDGYAAVLHIEKFENRSHQLGFRSNPNNPRVGVRTKNTGPYGAWRYFVFEDIFHAAIDVLDSKIAAFPAITSRMSSRAPAFLDDFYRSEQRPTTLGLSSSVWRWHNSGSFQVRNGIAQLANSAVRNSRYYARTGFTFKSYISSCTVEVGETFNFGWTYRVPDDSTTSNPRLYCRIYLNASGANRIRLGYGTSGSNDADAETVFDGEIHALGNQSHEFTFVQDGPRVLAFVNGALAMDHTITPDQDALLGHSAGINALIYSNIDELKIRRVVAWRLHDKPAKTPQVMAHRMVVKGPFGPDTYTTDTRDPESCLSALERLPSGVGIETDIRQSSDRHYILMHDPTVDRTTYGTGEVSAMTLAELTALKIRGLGGRNVPSLAELLRALEDRPDIPLAFLQLYGPNIADAIAEINQASPGVKARCVLFVNNLGQAQGARNVDADIRLAVGGRNNANESEIPDLVAARVEIGVISPGDTSYAANRGQVAKLHAAGIKVFASTTQMHYTMRQIAADGTDGYLSDYPTGSAA